MYLFGLFRFRLCRRDFELRRLAFRLQYHPVRLHSCTCSKGAQGRFIGIPSRNVRATGTSRLYTLGYRSTRCSTGFYPFCTSLQVFSGGGRDDPRDVFAPDLPGRIKASQDEPSRGPRRNLTISRTVLRILVVGYGRSPLHGKDWTIT